MKKDKLAFQVKFWAFIGPLISLLSLYVIGFKNSSVPFFLPISLLIGVVLSWRWKLWGFVGSVASLACLLAFYYTEISVEERFWFLGGGASIATAFFITALSYEEVEALIDSILIESRSRLENLWKVDEKKKIVEEELKRSQEKVLDLELKIRSYQKLIDMSTDEMIEAKTSYDKVLQELYEERKEKETLSDSVTKGKHEPPAEAKYLQLREQFEEKQQVLDETRRELFLVQEKLLKFQKEYEESKFYQLSEVEEALERHLVKMEEERVFTESEHEKEIEALQGVISGFLKDQQG